MSSDANKITDDVVGGEIHNKETNNTPDGSTLPITATENTQLNYGKIVYTSITKPSLTRNQRKQPNGIKFEEKQSTRTGDNDKAMWITGIALLDNGCIVAVDRRHSKCRLLNYQLQKQGTPYKLNGKPWDVTCYGDERVAVTIPIKGEILLLQVKQKTLLKRSRFALLEVLSTSFQPSSISVLDARSFVVGTLEDFQHARIVDIEGHESTFQGVTFPDKTYAWLGLSTCTYIQDNNTLVVSDFMNVIVYLHNTTTGSCIEVKDARIQKPGGVCPGPHGIVLVCCCSNNSVVKMTGSGEILESVHVDINLPRAIAVSQNGESLVVAGEGGIFYDFYDAGELLSEKY